MQKFSRVLVLAPHTDDGELGAGGLISKLVNEGATVTYVAYSTCEASIPPEFPRDILAFEVLEATAALGIERANVKIRNIPVRYFPDHRQEILEDMVSLRAEIDPDLVILPAKYDTHQDHQVIHNEGVRAFKKSTIIGYEMPWNNFHFDVNLLVKLDTQHIEAKLQAYLKYRSQAFRACTPDILKSLAVTRGLQAGSTYAEAFNITRWIWS